MKTPRKMRKKHAINHLFFGRVSDVPKIKFDILRWQRIGFLGGLSYMKMKQILVLGAVVGLASTRVALADPTAFDLGKKGDDYVGVQSKDKIIEIYSDKSVATLEPNIWYVVYYDPSVTFKTVEVKFGGGQEMDISHPVRPFQMPAKMENILDQTKLKIDSDRALTIATSQPLLKGLTLRSSKMTLSNVDEGLVWRVELWAAKVGDPTKQAGIGSVYISANDGSVVRTDLHPDSAN